jgi:RNA polymerase sigma factor for flagellar operon FliA
VRLDDVGEWEQNRCLATSPEAESEYNEQLVRDHLVKAVETLPERERLIVSEHYFNHVKFKSLGERLGVSEPRISQLHSRAMQRLRTAVAEQNL